MTNVVYRATSWLRAPANEVAFAVRSRVRWSRAGFVLGNEPKEGLFPSDSDLSARARELAEIFSLQALELRSTRRVFLEGLALLERLQHLAADLAPPAGPGDELLALDVGCGGFHYATALQRWLSRHAAATPRRVRLRGIEIDGHGIYADGHSRADHAQAHAALAGEGTSFEVGDFAKLEFPPQDVITLFYPFLTAYPLLRWGSPLSHLKPRRLLARAVAALRPGGWLVVANQTAGEFAKLRALLEGRGVTCARWIPFQSPFDPRAEATGDRVGSLWVREESLPNERAGG